MTFRFRACKSVVAAIASAVAALLLPSFASAAVITVSSDSDFLIPDDAYNGTLGSMVGSTVNVPALEGVISDVDLTVRAMHQFVGDLTIKLQSPTGEVITLLNRPGLGAPDNGTGIGGANADLSGNVPITFNDQIPGGVFAELMGAGLDFDDIVGAGASPAAYIPDSDTATDNGRLSSFDGDAAQGLWTLYIADSGPQGIGQLEGWSITITTVPEPTAVGMIAAGALVATRRRRR